MAQNPQKHEEGSARGRIGEIPVAADIENWMRNSGMQILPIKLLCPQTLNPKLRPRIGFRISGSAFMI